MIQLASNRGKDIFGEGIEHSNIYIYARVKSPSFGFSL